MIRVVLQELALFLVPFVLFAGLLVLQRKRVLLIESWSRHAVWLATAGLALVVGSFVLAGLFGEQHTGAYVPPHMENGRPVPGTFR